MVTVTLPVHPLVGQHLAVVRLERHYARFSQNTPRAAVFGSKSNGRIGAYHEHHLRLGGVKLGWIWRGCYSWLES